MNISLRWRPLNHHLGDLVDACYVVPQNPIVKGLAGLCGLGQSGSPVTEQYYWNGNGASCSLGMCSTPGAVAAANSGGLQPGVQSNGIPSNIQSVQSMTVTAGPTGLTPYPQTVSPYSSIATSRQGPYDCVWYYTPGSNLLKPTYPPAVGSTIGITYTPAPPPAAMPVPSQIYIPSTAPAAQAMPSATTSQPPSVVQAAQASPSAVAAGQQWSTTPINPQQLMKPLPQIVTHNPLPDVNPQCTNTFAQWVSQNMFLAAAGLVVAFFAVKGGSK
jgi:hypothetical protein